MFTLESLVGAQEGPGVCPSCPVRKAPASRPVARLNDLAGCFLRDKLDK